MAVELGRRLRQIREQRGISLDQIAYRTRIDQRYLIAIENGQFHLLPSEQHVKSYLRAYAMCIGVNPQSVLQLYSMPSGATQPRIAYGNMRSVPYETQPRLPIQRQRSARPLHHQEEVRYGEEGRAQEFAEEKDNVEEVQLSRRRSRKAKKERAGFLVWFDRLLVLLAILLVICGGIVFYLRMSSDQESLDLKSKTMAEIVETNV